jgi:hypothetical protein
VEESWWKYFWDRWYIFIPMLLAVYFVIERLFFGGPGIPAYPPGY